MPRLYRHPADHLPSVIVGAICCVQVLTFFFINNLGAVSGIMLLLLLFSACPGSISHNHHHCHTFVKPWMNRAYEVVLFMETGILPYAWTLHHNLGHHRHYLDPKRDTAPWQHADGRLMSRWQYDLQGAWRIYPETLRVAREFPELRKRFLLWGVVSLSVLMLFMLIDPLKALILFVAPMPLMYIGLLDNTYMQHTDLDTRSHYTASRNSTSRLYNMISWNLGFHSAHHMKPSLHWSQLPALHARIQPQIPEGVICDSLLLSRCTYRHSQHVTPVEALVMENPRIIPLPLPAQAGNDDDSLEAIAAQAKA